MAFCPGFIDLTSAPPAGDRSAPIAPLRGLHCQVVGRRIFHRDSVTPSPQPHPAWVGPAFVATVRLVPEMFGDRARVSRISSGVPGMPEHSRKIVGLGERDAGTIFHKVNQSHRFLIVYG